MNLFELEKLSALLLHVPRLVDLYENKDYVFIREVKRWFAETEYILKIARLPVVSDVAAWRASIIAAERGLRPEELKLPELASKGRVRDAVAIHSLGEAQKKVLAAVERDHDTFFQADKMLRGILVTASRKGIFNNETQPPFTPEKLKSLWTRLIADEDVGLPTSQVLAIIGYRDALALVQRILEEWAQDQNNT